MRNLEICAPFEKNLVDRCVHIRDKFDHDERDFGETWNSREAGGRTKFQRLAKRAVGLLERLEDESLKSFRLAKVPLIVLETSLITAT